jgi:hypothetical protein
VSVLIGSPTLRNFVVAGLRRAVVLAEEGMDRGLLFELQAELLRQADPLCGARWRGEMVELTRYPARQRKDIAFPGTVGPLALPRGPGDVWPLLAASYWMHVGKGTTLGLGQVDVETL